MALCGALCLNADAQTPREVRAIAKDGPSAIPELTEFLKNSDPSIRNEAVKGLVEIGGVRSLDPLIAATQNNDDQIQIRGVDGLVNFYVPGYVPSGMTANLKRASSSIKQRFGDRNDQVIDPYVTVRPEVVQAIGHVVRGGSSTESRANAARAVGILRGRAALPDLYETLHSQKETDVLYETVTAIQKIRDEQAGPKVQYLLRDLNERVRIAAIETTGILQNRAALPDLRNALHSSNKLKVRRAALAAIAMLPDPANRDLFAQNLDDKDEALRTAAAEGFGRLRSADDVPMLQKAYKAETKRAPQLALAFAMVMDGRTESSEQSPLKFLIQNLGNSGYRGTAQAYLTEAAQDPGLRLQLYAPMEHGTKEEKIGLAQVLAGTGDRGAESHLENISRDNDPQVAQEGLRALRNLRAGK